MAPGPPPASLAALAERAARAAGALLLEHAARGFAEVMTKSSSTDMVSAADVASEQLIAELLEAERPHDARLGEEGGHRAGTSGLTWIFDPLDGTTNYLYGLPQWCVSIAVGDGGGLAAGCVFDPSRDECFTAWRGGGTWLNGRPVAVSGAADLSRALVATGFSYDAGRRVEQAHDAVAVIRHVRDLRRLGAAALDLAWVACGRLDGYYETGLNPWDLAAGMLLVREAGGTVTADPFGNAGDELVVAATPALHAPLRALLP